MNKLILLFDLDGTLVNTDKIYIKVWNEILNDYNIDCNTIFFDHFIKGKSDYSFLNYIISNITKEDIINISKKKDELFIKYIKEEKKENILLESVEEFLKKYKNNQSNKSANTPRRSGPINDLGRRIVTGKFARKPAAFSSAAIFVRP